MKSQISGIKCHYCFDLTSFLKALKGHFEINWPLNAPLERIPTHFVTCHCEKCSWHGGKNASNFLWAQKRMGLTISLILFRE